MQCREHCRTGSSKDIQLFVSVSVGDYYTGDIDWEEYDNDESYDDGMSDKDDFVPILDH